ncbi:MAG: hypothetical protein ACM3SS_02675 [Rhodospirillaceae bacterium]
MSKHTALVFVETRPDLFRDDFRDWLDANFHIYEAFAGLADQMATRRDHYSARTLVEKLRFDSDMSERGGEFKINGNYAPDLARLWTCFNPNREGFFEKRSGQSARRAA